MTNLSDRESRLLEVVRSIDSDLLSDALFAGAAALVYLDRVNALQPMCKAHDAADVYQTLLSIAIASKEEV